MPWATAQQAKALPGVGRALSLICGLISTMPLNAVRGRDVLDPRPRLLDAPDPDNSLPWFLYQQVEDWWLHGNAVQLVTARSRNGWPAAVMPLQAERVNITITPASLNRPRVVAYWYDGVSLPTQDIIHVKRGVDPFMPERGVGVLEQHVLTLARARDQEEAERNNMASAGVPSVVIFTPGPVPTPEQMQDAKTRWMETHQGPGREPAFLPAGSEVKPLAWSPTDAQMVEARQLTLTDLSNIANLDPYWLGGSQGSLTYQSPGPLFLGLLRQTLEPILSALEAVWTRHWLPRGLLVKADRQAILGDDMGTTIGWLQTADSFGLLTKDEQRAYIGKSPLPASHYAPPVPPPVPDNIQDPEEVMVNE